MEDNKPTVNNLLDVRQAFNSKEVIENIKNNIINGTVNPLEGFTVLKRMAKVAEEVLKDDDIKRMASDEFDKYSAEAKGKSILLHSAQICKMATYTYYDFKDCKHEILDALYEIQEIVKHQIKVVEDELKLLVPKDDGFKAGAIPGLGIENTAKSVVFERFPKLIWEDYGVVGQVEQPRKVQTIGLKYMKL